MTFEILNNILHITYTGCLRRNVPDFRRMFLMLKYTDITQNTYIQSWMVTEIMARENWSSCGSTYCTCSADALLVHCAYPSLSVERCYCVTNGCTELQKCLLCFPTWNIVTCILCMDFAMAMHVLLLKNTKGVFPIEGFHLEVYLLVFTRHCVRLVVFCYSAPVDACWKLHSNWRRTLWTITVKQVLYFSTVM